MCNITKCCTEVCPEHIKITDNAIIPMKERVVDTKYDPLVWLGNKIPRRAAMAASRSLSAGDTEAAEAQARDRLRDKPSDTRRAARRWPSRCARRAGSPTRRMPPAPWSSTPAVAGRPGWTPCRCTPGSCSAPSRPASSTLERIEDEIAAAVQQAQRLASTGTVLAGTHALHQLVHGRLAESVEHAREAHRLGPRPVDPGRRPGHPLRRRWPGLGESEESASAMAEAQQLWPDNPRLAGVRANLEDMNVTTS